MNVGMLRRIIKHAPDSAEVYAISRIKIDVDGFADVADVEDPMIVCGARDDIVLVLDTLSE